jgi:hypothetical protein
VTRLEEDFATLERSRPGARGAAAVFEGAAGTARRRRRTARLATTGVAVVVTALVVGGVALAGGGSEDDVNTGPGVAGSPDGTVQPVEPPDVTTSMAPTTSVPVQPPSTTLPSASQLDAEDLVDIRVLSAGGADQVIFQLADGTAPVLEAAVVQPSADLPLDCVPAGLDAPAYLLVTLGAATERTHLGVPQALEGVRTYDSARRVTGVAVGCVFDGELTAAIGLNTDQVATAIDRLDGPPRLLVEVYPA